MTDAEILDRVGFPATFRPVVTSRNFGPKVHADKRHVNTAVTIEEVSRKDGEIFLVRVSTSCRIPRYAHEIVSPYRCAFWVAPWELERIS